MSSHRISRPTPELAALIAADVEALSTDRIRQALHADARHLLPDGMEGTISRPTRAMTSGIRAAVYAVLTVSPPGYDGVARRDEMAVIVSWTFHRRIDDRAPELVLALDRIGVDAD